MRPTVPALPCSFLILVMCVAAPAVRLEAALDDLEVEQVFSGLENPVWVNADSAGSLMVTLLAGVVQRRTPSGPLSGDFVLDIQDRVRGGGGLHSIAFHPTEPWLFAHYSEAESGDMVISRFDLSGDPPVADVATEAVLIRAEKSFPLHYGGQIAFGPDGYLWVSTGDGTSPIDGPDPACAAQDTDSLEGKILRLDVDSNSAMAPFWAVPGGNPFANGGGDPAVWGLGLRNPWRFSFDRETGDLWVSDVGQDQREEVSFLASSSGAGTNFGWKVMEGTRCSSDLSACEGVLECGDSGLHLPTIEYSNAAGRCAVIGGFVYRGRLAPSLFGRYLFGDFCSGEVWAYPVGGSGLGDLLPVTVVNANSFGEDANGEIWMTAGDRVYLLVDRSLPAAGLVELERRSILSEEGDGGVAISVLRVGGDAGMVRVRATPTGIDAVAGIDFDGTPVEITWEDGESGARLFEIPVIDDTLIEGVEKIEVSLELIAGEARLGARDMALVSIGDNDGCSPGANNLCLNDGRFDVSIGWRTAAGLEGQGKAVPLDQGGDDAGMFWFFSPNNPEVFVKVLDACQLVGFDNFWVFSAGLTDVETTLRVHDTESGELHVYHRPLGMPYVAVQDTGSFETCP